MKPIRLELKPVIGRLTINKDIFPVYKKQQSRMSAPIEELLKTIRGNLIKTHTDEKARPQIPHR